MGEEAFLTGIDCDDARRTIDVGDQKAILAEARRIRGEKAAAAAARRTRRKAAEMAARATAAADRRHDDGPGWEIRTGDCVAGLAAVDPGSARLVFADPPYNIGIDYGPHCDDNRPTVTFLTWCQSWIAAARRALTPDGSLMLLINWEWAHDLAIAARTIGYAIRQTIIWYESFGVNTTRMYNRTSRCILWLTKDVRSFVFNDHAPEVRRTSARQAIYRDARAAPDGKLWDDVWGVHPPIPRLTGTCNERLPGFPTQLPLALLRPIVAAHADPGDLVIDPFCGSGTTGVACLELGRQFLGFELSATFAKTARLRLTATGTGLPFVAPVTLNGPRQ